MKNKGFTLLELMVVIAIISILSSAALYNYFASMPRRKVEGAVRLLYYAISNTKVMAVKKGETITISFYPSEKKYLIKDGNFKVLDSRQFDTGVLFYRTKGSRKAFSYSYNSRGIKVGVSDSVKVCYLSENDAKFFKRVRLTSVGMSIQSSDDGESWN